MSLTTILVMVLGVGGKMMADEIVFPDPPTPLELINLENTFEV